MSMTEMFNNFLQGHPLNTFKKAVLLKKMFLQCRRDILLNIVLNLQIECLFKSR